MARTFKEKVEYNHGRVKVSEFSAGYDLSVYLYQSYIKAPEQARQQINVIFDNARKNLATSRVALKNAKNDIAKASAQRAVDYNNGILCGMRDAANERKKRQPPLS